MLYLVCGGSSLEGWPPGIGSIVGPRTGGLLPLREGRPFAADNDAFGGRFTEAGFLAHLGRLLPYRETCLFVAAPDVVADPVATAALFAGWGPRIRNVGFPCAWVAQDGALPGDIPDCDAVFIGGSTAWKLGSAAWAIAQAARAQGRWVHMGRVNSERRIIHAARIGADSVDGTYIVYKGNAVGMRDIARWVDAAGHARGQPRLL